MIVVSCINFHKEVIGLIRAINTTKSRQSVGILLYLFKQLSYFGFQFWQMVYYDTPKDIN